MENEVVLLVHVHAQAHAHVVVVSESDMLIPRSSELTSYPISSSAC
jgi:hypothetical protein